MNFLFHDCYTSLLSDMPLAVKLHSSREHTRFFTELHFARWHKFDECIGRNLC